MTARTLRWAETTTVAADGLDRVLVSSASIGRAWRVKTSAFVEVVVWMADQRTSPPPLAGKLEAAGLLVDQNDQDDQVLVGRSPTADYHMWAERDDYHDGADELAAVREYLVDRFEPDTHRAIRNLAELRPAPDAILSGMLADVVWQATGRVRLYRQIMRIQPSAATLLYSYGAAYDLYVLDSGAGERSVIHADPDYRGRGRAVAADAGSVLRRAGIDGAGVGVAVVGRIEDYQLRYHHAKALRGFFVDGGRLLAEVGRALQQQVLHARLSRMPLGTGLCGELGLVADTHVVFGIAYADRANLTG